MGTKLQTIVPIEEGEPKIDYHSRIVLLGSCFSENIGDKLHYFKFDAWSNPFGVIFNPYSIERVLERTIQNIPFETIDAFENEGLWRSFEVHSQWVEKSQDSLVLLLNDKVQEVRDYLTTTTHSIITLGSAWVYRHKETNKWVANCHKVPGTKFQKELLEVETIVNSLSKMANLLRQVNPKMRIIFTVSPVRHIKDGFVENNRSKGRLLDAIQKVVENSEALYFPSYEIMLDELRDYRFYKDDLLHPNSLAVDYLWEKFQESWIRADLREVMLEVDAIQKALEHKPMHPESASYNDFKIKLQERIRSFSEKYPHLKF